MDPGNGQVLSIVTAMDPVPDLRAVIVFRDRLSKPKCTDSNSRPLVRSHRKKWQEKTLNCLFGFLYEKSEAALLLASCTKDARKERD